MESRSEAPHQSSAFDRRRPALAHRALRGLLVLDGAVFLLSSLFNLGVRIPLGFVTLGFPSPIWQAAIGEIVIGAGLLAAARTGRGSHALIAGVAASLGIAFGLSSAAVVGSARDIHVLLVPLTALVFLVLALDGTTREHLPASGPRMPPQHVDHPANDRAAVSPATTMAVASAAYAGASAIHFGLVVPLGFVTLRDPFAGAAAPEAIIAAVLLACAIAVALRIDGAWLAAVLGSAFSGMLTLVGLSITLRADRPGDIAYHLGVLGLLAANLVLMLRPSTRHAVQEGTDARA